MKKKVPASRDYCQPGTIFSVRLNGENSPGWHAPPINTAARSIVSNSFACAGAKFSPALPGQFSDCVYRVKNSLGKPRSRI